MVNDDIKSLQRRALLVTWMGCALALAASRPATAAVSFERRDYATGSGPTSVAIADLNGDGQPDLAVANGSGTTISVLMGLPEGEFALRADYVTGDRSRSVIVGDWNGDGHLDLASGDMGNVFSILLGDGNGAFGARLAVPMVGFGPHRLATADLNGDGALDIVATHGGGYEIPSAVSIYVGDGAAGFNRVMDVSVGLTIGIALTDLDHDGELDLVAATRASVGWAGVALGNGDGSFKPVTLFPTGGGQSATLAVGDFNVDAHPDVAVASWSGAVVTILLGNGDGTLTGGQALVTGSEPHPVAIGWVAAGDLDRDGHLDLCVTSAVSNTISLFFGLEDGTLGGKESIEVGTFPDYVTLGDVDADGWTDIVVANRDANTISVLLNRTPLPVTITDFTAVHSSSGGVVLTWRMSEEALREIAAVRLLRADAVEGPYRDLGLQLTPASSMFFEDRTAGSSACYQLALLDLDGNTSHAGPVCVIDRPATDSLALHLPGQPVGARPIRIGYSIGAGPALVELDVYSVLGTRVRRVEAAVRGPGSYSAIWDGRNESGTRVARGVYLIRLAAGARAITKKLVLASD